METIFRVNVSELNSGFLEVIKALFGMEREVEIAVQPSSAKHLRKQESRDAYFARLKKAKDNAEKGNVISFSSEELEAFSKKLKGK